MCRGHEEVLDEILLLGLHAHTATAASALRAIEGHRRALDVAVVRNRDRDVFVRDCVLDRDLVRDIDDLGATRIRVCRLEIAEFGADDVVDLLAAREDRLQPRDRGLDLGELVDDLLPLEARETLELQFEDGSRLDVAQAELGDEADAGLARGRGIADELDDRVEVVEGNDVATQNVGTRLCLAQLELGPPAHDLAPEVEEVVADLEEIEDPRAAVDDRQHDDAERVLELGLLVELIEQDLRGLILADIDDDAHAAAIALVARLGDALDLLLADEFSDALDKPRLVHLVGKLGDHDGFAVVLALLDFGACAHGDGAAAGAEGGADAVAAEDEAAGREVGAENPLHQAFEALVVGGSRLLVLEEVQESFDDLAQIVGRDVRGHADGDAGRAVDEEVGKDGREDGRLFEAVVVVRLELDGLLVEIGHHRGGDLREPRLGVAHGRGRIAVDRTEVALAIDEDGPHVEGLSHADEGVVDRGVAVRVVLTHDVADDAGALSEGTTGVQAELVHREEHAPVGGLEAVADVGQSAPDDDGHCVVHVGLAHLVRDVDGRIAIVRERTRRGGIVCRVDRLVGHDGFPTRRGSRRTARCPR
jgi:hypothetical protein